MGRRPWNTHEAQDALSLEWLSFQEQYPDRTYAGWCCKRSELRQRDPEAQNDTAWIDAPSKPTPDEEESYFRLLEQQLSERQRLWNPAGGTVRIGLPDDGPILLVFTGDWHGGHPHVDYTRLRQDLLDCAGIKGLYLVGMGDYKDNRKVNTKPGAAVYDGGFTSPAEQDRWVLARMRYCAGQWLALIEGNHDYWDHIAGGIDNFDQLCQQVWARNMGHGGVLRLLLGNQEYCGILRHQFPGASSINTSNNQRRLLESFAAELPDFVCLGHLHFNDMHQITKHHAQHPVTMLRSGSYQIYDDYSEQKVGSSGSIGTPSVILLHDSHKCIPFAGNMLQDAIQYFKFLKNNS